MTDPDRPREPRLTRHDMEHILSASDLDPSLLRSWSAMEGGTFNAAYRIRLTDGTGLVLKVAPPPDVPTLTYEHGLLAAEELFYTRAAETGTVPVPRWVRADLSREILPADYLLMSECAGTNWSNHRDQIEEDDRNRLRRELGRMTAALHQVHGPGFGYPSESVAPLSSTWREAFLAMTTAVLSDAAHFNVALPRQGAEIDELLHAAASVLDHVLTPALVHFDLWNGNILVGTTNSTPEITGLIDGERMMWGDPAADFVSLALFSDIERDTSFLAGYRAGGGQAEFNQSLRLRLTLYEIYLYVIMLTEAAPRGYAGPDHRRTSHRISERLVIALDTTERSLR